MVHLSNIIIHCIISYRTDNINYKQTGTVHLYFNFYLLSFQGFAIEGPSQAKIECDDHNDGSCLMRFWPTEAGEYAVHVMCDDEEIQDSPFMTSIRPKRKDFHPEKVNSYILLY